MTKIHFICIFFHVCWISAKTEFLISQCSVEHAKVRWVMSYGFCSKFHVLSNCAKFFEKSVKIWWSYREFEDGNFFETQCISCLKEHSVAWTLLLQLAMQSLKLYKCPKWAKQVLYYMYIQNSKNALIWSVEHTVSNRYIHMLYHKPRFLDYNSHSWLLKKIYDWLFWLATQVLKLRLWATERIQWRKYGLK